MENRYSLKWNNHQSTVLSAVNNLFNSERHADCILAAEGESLKVHKLMISACSPYLEKLLEDHTLDKNTPIIIFNDITFVELKALCEYMYKGEVHIPQEKLESFLKVARCMQIRGLCDQGGSDTSSGTQSGQPKQEKQKAEPKQNMKRKRTDPPEPDGLWDAKVKAKPRTEPPVATCPPVRIKQEPVKTQEKVEEEEFEEFENYGNNDIYQDSNLAGPSNENIVNDFTWNDGSNDFTGPDNGTNSDQDGAIYCCLPCGKMYKKVKSLRSHLRYECGKEAEYACPHCPYKSKQRGYLNQHIKIRHSDASEVFQCHICDYSTKYKSNYNIHVRSPHKKVQAKSKKSSDPSATGEYLCSTCGKTFAKAVGLKNHVKNICGSKTVYKCPHCAYKSKMKGNVMQHIKVQHDPNLMLFKCGYCEYTTKYSRVLRAHLITKHSNANPDTEILSASNIVIQASKTDHEIIEPKEEAASDESVLQDTTASKLASEVEIMFEKKQPYCEIVEEACSEIIEETIVPYSES